MERADYIKVSPESAKAVYALVFVKSVDVPLALAVQSE
jgi:hypothetical protein